LIENGHGVFTSEFIHSPKGAHFQYFSIQI